MEQARTHCAVAFTGGIDSVTVCYYLADRFQQLGRKNVEMTLLYGDMGQCTFEKTYELAGLHRSKLEHLYPEMKFYQNSVQVYLPPYVRECGIFRYGYKPDHNDPEVIDYSDPHKSYEYCFIEGMEAAIFLQLLIYCSHFNIPMLYTGHQNEPDEWENWDSYVHRTQDASPAAMDRYNTMQELGFSRRVRIENPFITYMMSKKEIGALAVEKFGIDIINTTYSCQFFPPCNKCGGCKMRHVTVNRLVEEGYNLGRSIS